MNGYDIGHNIEDNFECNGKIMLEPRLQEYIKRKRTSNDPHLEIQYAITEEDKLIIRAYLLGDRDIYNGKKQDQFVCYNKTGISTGFDGFSSKELENDPRLSKLKEKLKRDREAMYQRHNYGETLDSMIPDCTNSIVTDINRSDKQREDNTISESQKFNIPDCRNIYDDCNINLPFKKNSDNVERDFRYQSRYSTNNANKLMQKTDPRVYHNPRKVPRYYPWSNTSAVDVDKFISFPPKIQYKHSIYPDNNFPQPNDISHNQINGLPHNSELMDIIGNLDTYAESDNDYRRYQYSSEMDVNSRVMIPTIASNKKRENTTNYKSVPFMKSNYNVEADNKLKFSRCGNYPLLSSKKTYGYDNPSEHYFDYIDWDIQNPDHVVMNDGPRGGISTRLDNHDLPLKYKRDILN